MRVRSYSESSPTGFFSEPHVCNRKRSKSFYGIDFKFHIEENSLWRFKKEPTHSTLNSSDLEKYLNINCQITNVRLQKSDEIDAKNYIFLGAAKNVPINKCGISMDKEGNLLLIKGKSYNLLKGTLKKYSTGFRYETSVLSLINEGRTLHFCSLYLNNDGLLLGCEKETDKIFSINIEMQGGTYGHSTKERKLSVKLYEYANPGDTTMSFYYSNERKLSFSFLNGKLLLDSVEKVMAKRDYPPHSDEIALPFKKEVKLVSVKKTQNLLQLEVLKSGRKRIYYLDPLHVSANKLKARKISHKPPQNLSGKLGCDPHEKYYSGQPFSPSRLGNFSSHNIPLFSPFIDNFRTHLKRCKIHQAKREYKKSFIDIARSADIGFEAVTKTTRQFTKKFIVRQHCKDKYKNKNNMLQKNQHTAKIHKKDMQKIIYEVNGKSQDFIGGLIKITNSLKPEESFVLDSSNRMGFFLGIASGGKPFNPGWFAGGLGSIMNSFSIELQLKEYDSIRLTIKNNSLREFVVLAGSGQGMEDDYKLLSRHGHDFFTLLPYEGNLIVDYKVNNCDSFSFNINKIALKQLLEGIFNSGRHPEIKKHFIDNAQVGKTKNTEVTIKVEAKLELRAEWGSKVIPPIYLVLPRSALGVCGTLNLFKYKSNKEITVHESSQKDLQETTCTTLLGCEAEIFNENKIMPIALNVEKKTWCFPLPLTEEKNNIKYFNYSWLKLPVKACSSSLQPVPSEYEVNLPCFHQKIRTHGNIFKTPLIYTRKGKRFKAGDTTLKDLVKNQPQWQSMKRDLKDIRSYFFQESRNSLNKVTKTYFTAKYELNEEGRYMLENVNEKIRNLSENAVLPEEIKTAVALLKKNARYRLTEIQLHRQSQRVHVSQLPLAILNFANQTRIIHNECIGKMTFNYGEEPLIPEEATNSLPVLT